MTRTVIVVEDDKEEQEKARKVFENMGYRVVVAGSYEEFQNKARQFNCFRDVSSGGKEIYCENNPDFPEDKKTGELVDCIVTDLTFPAGPPGSEIGDFGFAVLARAAKLGVPCYICTNSEHHGPSGKRRLIEEMMKITGGLVTQYSYKKQWASFILVS